tara:strand:+ start:1051 stop:2148 length:1098 start_codon:yes stop_codon:yes gene_type:complete
MPEALTLTDEQSQAIDDVLDWFRGGMPTKQFFKLFGHAGTGKTTIVKALFDRLPDTGIILATYTGKAAQVLSRKSGHRASTIHRLIYKYDGKDKKGNLIFGDADTSRLMHAGLLVIDECSMISQDIMNDLLKWGCPILAVGDPGQLPPVKGLPFFQEDPDVILQTIHRQAWDSEIIRAATAVRKGEPYHGFDDDVSFVKKIGGITDELLADVDQILVGKNETRKSANTYMRKFFGFTGDLPEIGERVVCLRNNHDIGIFNGETFTITNVFGMCGDGSFFADLAPEIGAEVPGVLMHVGSFNGDDINQACGLFDFGYALTVNKAQGSEWPRVLLIDDKLRPHDKTFRKQWLYTGITRASESIVIAE